MWSVQFHHLAAHLMDLQLSGSASQDAPVSRSTTAPRMIAVKRKLSRGSDKRRSGREEQSSRSCPLTPSVL
jgi:hypothetical protein